MSEPTDIGEDELVVLAYGAPPVSEQELGRDDERYSIARWLRRVDAISLVGRRTVSVATVPEVVEALADAIERGEHRKTSI